MSEFSHPDPDNISPEAAARVLREYEDMIARWKLEGTPKLSDEELSMLNGELRPDSTHPKLSRSETELLNKQAENTNPEQGIKSDENSDS